jgi:DNA-binding Lrp family transcriptional regulator
VAGSKKDKKVNNLNEFDFENYELTKTDKKLFKLVTEQPELTQGQIAEKLNITQEWVSRSMSKAVFKKAINDFNGSWIQTILDAKQRAADRLVEFIDDANPTIAMRAIEQVLQLDTVDLSDGAKVRDAVVRVEYV